MNDYNAETNFLTETLMVLLQCLESSNSFRSLARWVSVVEVTGLRSSKLSKLYFEVIFRCILI